MDELDKVTFLCSWHCIRCLLHIVTIVDKIDKVVSTVVDIR